MKYFYNKKKRKKYLADILLKHAAVVKLLKSSYNCWSLFIVLKKFYRSIKQLRETEKQKNKRKE